MMLSAGRAPWTGLARCRGDRFAILGLANQECAGRGEGDWSWGFPEEIACVIASCAYLGIADQEGEAAVWPYQAGGDWKDFVETLYGAEGHDICFGGEVLGAAGEYIDVRQCKGANYFAEECGFFLIGFDQGQVDLRGPDFYGDSGKAGAGAYVDYVVDRSSLVVGLWE
jgi:hypothetical protein